MLDEESVTLRDADRGPGRRGLLGPDFFSTSGSEVSISGLEFAASSSFEDPVPRSGVVLSNGLPGASSGDGFVPGMFKRQNWLKPVSGIVCHNNCLEHLCTLISLSYLQYL